MSESLITISITGLIAGFVFSMPIAGPISILITSNALKGRLKYCYYVTMGASLADLVYVFIAVFGLTRFFSLYKPAIPYLTGAGSIFIIYIGYTIFRTKIDLEHIDDKVHLSEKIKKKGNSGFYTGLLLNFLNPTLFFGWLTTSFIIISIVSSLGFNTGGLNSMIDQNINDLNNIGGNVIQKPKLPEYLRFDTLQIFKNGNPVLKPKPRLPKNFNWLISICFAFSLSLGSVIWFYVLAVFIYYCRKRINIKILNLIINSLGLILSSFGIFLLYKTLSMML